MARSLDQIITELNTAYDPQRQSIQGQINQLPQLQQAQEQGLDAQKNDAFGSIVDGARQRGLGFSGIPLGEQAKYTASTYLPALANLKQSFNTQRASLGDALNNINLDQNKYAQTLRQAELDREQQQAQFEQQQAAARAAAAQAASAGSGWLSALGGGGGDYGSAAAAQRAATIAQRADKGFNFTDANGRAISAAQYSQIKGIPYRTLLQQMANAGDNGARVALGYVGNDYGYNAQKLGSNSSVANILNSLLWGVNSAKAAATPSRAPASNYNPNRSVLGVNNPLALRR